MVLGDAEYVADDAINDPCAFFAETNLQAVPRAWGQMLHAPPMPFLRLRDRSSAVIIHCIST